MDLLQKVLISQPNLKLQLPLRSKMMNHPTVLRVDSVVKKVTVIMMMVNTAQKPTPTMVVVKVNTAAQAIVVHQVEDNTPELLNHLMEDLVVQDPTQVAQDQADQAALLDSEISHNQDSLPHKPTTTAILAHLPLVDNLREVVELEDSQVVGVDHQASNPTAVQAFPSEATLVDHTTLLTQVLQHTTLAVPPEALQATTLEHHLITQVHKLTVALHPLLSVVSEVVIVLVETCTLLPTRINLLEQDHTMPTLTLVTLVISQLTLTPEAHSNMMVHQEGSMVVLVVAMVPQEGSMVVLVVVLKAILVQVVQVLQPLPAGLGVLAGSTKLGT